VCGNITALIGTGFLLGPKTQCKRMWDPTRRFSAAFYLTMLIVVFAVAVSGQNVGIVLVMLMIEICAATWYGLSYVPFGRKIVIEFAKRTCKCGGGAK
jgi:general stress protein CsbA